MTFSFTNFKREFAKKYSHKLSDKEVEELLTFEQGFLEDKFPQKRLVIEQILFSGVKTTDGKQEAFTFDKRLNEGLYMLIADNLKGKSSVFKIIKFALTGDNDISVDIKSWLKNIYLEFKINDIFYTAYLNLEKPITKGCLYQSTLIQIIENNQEDSNQIFYSESAIGYKASIQDFFFNQFQFYHLNWTQKSSQKDKNELIESKASWNTYFESIYLTSRASTTLAFGNQEELIFQMLLGLKLTYPINRIKTKLEKTQFDLAKLRDFNSRETKNKTVELKNLEKQLENIQKELKKLNSLEKNEIDLSKIYEKRNEITAAIDIINNEQSEIDNSVISLKRSNSQIQIQNQDITSEGNKYKDLIKKSQRNKIGLEGVHFKFSQIEICNADRN